MRRIPRLPTSSSSIRTSNDWPLNERAIVDGALGRWASSRHKLVVFGKRFEEMPRRHSRFVEWRRQWSHIVQCRTDDDIEADALPTLLLVPGAVSVRLLDRVRYRGLASGKPIDLVEGREAIDALLQRSTESLSGDDARSSRESP